ncbi:MAG: 6,7-dimethyl-8-ribityllumazine synthase [Candidatus Gracilibacteria bacterium]|nr:6,7-dimethyl-8-ribityllumazine synthase [Candidatus Gracilibacteria bacterium]
MSDYKAGLRNIDNLDRDLSIAFVVGEFNFEYTSEIERQNRDFLEKHGFKNIDTFFVPGAFELPGFAKRLIESEQYDLIIAIGVVIRGDTPHFDYVCNETSRGIMDLNIVYDVPVIFGVLTCNTEEQVKVRIGPNFAIAGLNLVSEIMKIEE